MSQTLNVTAGTLPEGVCSLITSEQTRLEQFAAVMSVVVPSGSASVILSATKPTDTTAVWGKLDALGRIVRYYVYYNGSWISAHTLVPGHTMIWTEALPDFTTFDGGDAGAAGLYSGPMWEINTVIHGTADPATMVARFPMSVGKMADTATAVAVGNTGGEELHSLLETEMPPHQHFIAATAAEYTPATPDGVPNLTPTTYLTTRAAGGAYSYAVQPNTAEADVGLTSNKGGDAATPPVVVGHKTIPPFAGCYFLRRTDRLYFVE